ncbi:MAG: hypothetical protein V3T53_05645 [Phycisphaerales bacterium]
MIIRLKKGRGKPDVLTCIRSDGSTTWTRLRIPAQHDLVHYVVETTLGLRDSFYGLVARGVDITDFEKPKEQQTFQTPIEAVHTEYIVGLLQMELANGAPYEDFNAQLRAMCEQNRFSAPPEIEPEVIQRIRQAVSAILYEWQTVAPGQTFELTYNERQPQMSTHART